MTVNNSILLGNAGYSSKYFLNNIFTFQNTLYTSVSDPEQLSVSIVRKRGLLLGIWRTPWAVPASQWYLNRSVNQSINQSIN